MNLTEARDNEGKRVRYRPPGCVQSEYGVITGFSTLLHVFVRYDGSSQSKATLPEDLELVVDESGWITEKTWVETTPRGVVQVTFDGTVYLIDGVIVPPERYADAIKTGIW
jgi:hypothetical protein